MSSSARSVSIARLSAVFFTGDRARSAWCIFAAVEVARLIARRTFAPTDASSSASRSTPSPWRHRMRCSAVSLCTKTVPSRAVWTRKTNMRPSWRAFASSTSVALPSGTVTRAPSIPLSDSWRSDSSASVQRSENAVACDGPLCTRSTTHGAHRITESEAAVVGDSSPLGGTWHTSSSRLRGRRSIRRDEQSL